MKLIASILAGILVAGICAAGDMPYSFFAEEFAAASRPAAGGSTWPLYPVWWTATMTDSNAPSPNVISASSRYESDSYAGWRASDDLWSTRWQSATENPPWTWTYDCGTPQTAVSLCFFPFTSAGYGPSGFVWQASANNVDWTPLVTATGVSSAAIVQMFENPTPTAYRYYQLNITSGWQAQQVLMLEIGMSSAKMNPVMTAADAPSPYVVTATTTNSTYYPYLACDRNIAEPSKWVSSAGAPQSIQIYLGTTPKVCCKYSIWGNIEAAPGSHYPKSVSFEGSNDGAAWTLVSSNDTANDTSYPQSFTNANSTAYSYYRLTANTTWSGALVVLREWRLWLFD